MASHIKELASWRPPFIPGHEGVGRGVELGSHVAEVKAR